MWLFNHNKWVFHGFSRAELLHFLSTMRSAIEPIALLCLELPWQPDQISSYLLSRLDRYLASIGMKGMWKPIEDFNMLA